MTAPMANVKQIGGIEQSLQTLRLPASGVLDSPSGTSDTSAKSAAVFIADNGRAAQSGEETHMTDREPDAEELATAEAEVEAHEIQDDENAGEPIIVNAGCGVGTK